MIIVHFLSTKTCSSLFSYLLFSPTICVCYKKHNDSSSKTLAISLTSNNKLNTCNVLATLCPCASLNGNQWLCGLHHHYHLYLYILDTKISNISSLNNFFFDLNLYLFKAGEKFFFFLIWPVHRICVHILKEHELFGLVD